LFDQSLNHFPANERLFQLKRDLYIDIGFASLLRADPCLSASEGRSVVALAPAFEADARTICKQIFCLGLPDKFRRTDLLERRAEMPAFMNWFHMRLFGEHHAGLKTLFYIEMWERFSYYGMRCLLLLYMVAAVEQGGLGFSEHSAELTYGWYTSLVYLTPLLGGLLADWCWGARRSMLLGGMIIAAGHFTMVFPSLLSFYVGLGLIVAGTGLLKGNIQTMVGQLYTEEDARRKAAFRLYYMGINVGAFLAPIVCGMLGKNAGFKSVLAFLGQDPTTSWHWGFAAAGVGMVFGLVHYWRDRKTLTGIGDRVLQSPKSTEIPGKLPVGKEPLLTWHDLRRLAALMILFAGAVCFWSIAEQAGTSLSLFADHHTRETLLGIHIDSPLYQAINPLWVIVLTPVFAAIFAHLAKRGIDPSTATLFAIGLFFLAVGTAVMVPAAKLAVEGKVSPLWLMSLYFIQTVGELCLSPIGNEAATRLAPKRFKGLAMGIWLMSSAVAAFLASHLATLASANDPHSTMLLFAGLTAAAVVFAGAMLVVRPWVNRLMQ
jgi:POT family proton-dependent oligopeptide transporter